MLLSLGELKFTSNSFVKDNKKPYMKKEEKIIHMADRPKTPPKIQRSSSSNDINYTFLVQTRLLLQDLMKRGLL